MNLDITGTQSEENVMTAFTCESQARNRYTFFARQARNEGNEEAADLFETMADNEREHAKVWFKVLTGGMVDTSSHLEDAASREHEEWTSLYPGFAQVAREEGLELLAIMFENIAAIEKNHETLFLELLAKQSASGASTLPKQPTFQTCPHCGYLSPTLPPICPVCGAALGSAI